MGMKTYKYKLYPCKQTKHIDNELFIACEIWNHCLQLQHRYYALTGKYITANRMKIHVTKLKRLPKYKHWTQLGSQAIQDVIERQDRAYKAFFDWTKMAKTNRTNRRKSPPHFRKACKYSSFTLKQAGYAIEENHISILGHNYKFYRYRDYEGIVKTLTVKRSATGEYYIYLVCQQEDVTPVSRTGNAVGYDFGLKHFLTDSEGNTYDLPLFYDQSLQNLKRLHRQLSRKQKGSHNRNRARIELAKTSEKIKNQRQDWFYKLAYQLTDSAAVLSFETLNMNAMKKLWGKKISDEAFAEFLTIVKEVSAKRGCQVVCIDRWYPSSKTCHNCGLVYPNLSLKEREWQCTGCGETHDRDVNAALNIRDEGLNLLA